MYSNSRFLSEEQLSLDRILKIINLIYIYITINFKYFVCNLRYNYFLYIDIYSKRLTSHPESNNFITTPFYRLYRRLKKY